MIVLLATLASAATERVECDEWPTNALVSELEGAYAWVSPTVCVQTELPPPRQPLFEFRFTPVPEDLALPDYLDQAAAEVHVYATVLADATATSADAGDLDSCTRDHSDTLRRLSVGLDAAAFEARSAWLEGQRDRATRHRALVDVALARSRLLAMQSHICYSST